MALRPNSTCKYDVLHKHSNDIELNRCFRTFPGFEATVPVGSVIEVELLKGNNGTVNTTNFDPIIKMLPVDLSIKSTEVHVGVTVGPKAGLNIGLPTPIKNLGMGIGIRLDLIRFDGKFSEFTSKWSSRLIWKTLKSNEARAISFKAANFHPKQTSPVNAPSPRLKRVSSKSEMKLSKTLSASPWT